MSDDGRPTHRTDDGEKYTYRYNPWGQLVQVKNKASPFNVRANITYLASA